MQFCCKQSFVTRRKHVKLVRDPPFFKNSLSSALLKLITVNCKINSRSIWINNRWHEIHELYVLGKCRSVGKEELYLGQDKSIG